MRKPKGYQSKPRNTGSKNRRPLLLLAAEGKNKTETRYFRDFLDCGRCTVQFARGNATDPVNMMKDLIAAYKEKGLEPELGDTAYCLIDTDTNPAKDAKIAEAEAMSDDNIKLIVSNPCFEIWFLCHFTYSTRQYRTSQELVDTLNCPDMLPGYSKADISTWKRLEGKMDNAIDNADRLKVFCEGIKAKPHTVAFGPSTEVTEIIRKFF